MPQLRVHCLLDGNHRAYQGRDKAAVKYVKKVKALID